MGTLIKHALAALFAGTLTLLLVACNGGSGGAPNQPPTADAGEAQSVTVGDPVSLDGSGSTDPDGDDLTFAWELRSKPDGSSAELAGADTPAAGFVADAAGEYEVALTVSDGQESDSDTVLITAAAPGPGNTPPVADAGGDATVPAGQEVILDGSASSNADGDDLTFSWELSSRPDGSSAHLADADTQNPAFIPDMAGEYVVELTVSDGEDTDSDSVTITATGNQPPVADAGGDVTTAAGQTVQLDGSGSSDPDGDDLTYSWSIISAPEASTAELNNPDSPQPSFTPDLPDFYVVQLTVSDGSLEDSDTAVITATRPGGTISSILHVSPDGADSNPGTAREPLRSVGQAINLANGNPDIRTVRLAAGTYDNEPYGYEIRRSLQLVGPDDPATPAVLSSGADLLKLKGNPGDDPFLTLARVTLQTDGLALSVGADASVSLERVTCEARSCVQSGTLLLFTPVDAGGRVQVSDSHFSGTGEGTGIGAVLTDQLSIRNTTIEGFRTGVTAAFATATLQEGTVMRGNDTGLLVLGGDGDGVPVRVTNAEFKDNRTGVHTMAANDLRLSSSTVSGGSRGVVIDMGGYVVLERMTIETDGTGTGIIIGKEASNDAEHVIIRSSTIRGGDLGGGGIHVHGELTELDLGTQQEAGNNAVDGTIYSLRDERPSGATGRITVSDTTLASSDLPQRHKYEGPTFVPEYKLFIANETVVWVYRTAGQQP